MVREWFLREIPFLSAILSGLALGTKYNGLIAFFILTLFVPFIYSGYNRDKRSVFQTYLICNAFSFCSPSFLLDDQKLRLDELPSLSTLRSLVQSSKWYQSTIRESFYLSNCDV
jgi:hypothetical protein